MHKTLRNGISAAALAAAVAMVAAPAWADHHGGWVSGSGGSTVGGSSGNGGASASFSGGNGGNASAPASVAPSGGGGTWKPSVDASSVHDPSGGGSSNTYNGGNWSSRPANVHTAHVHFFNKGQNFAQFNPAQRQSWTHGHWWHGHHHGHDGWWWYAGGAWFFYPFAVYPYPDYVSGEADYNQEAPAQNWWYCPDPAGYYPYVQRCMVPWQSVPATPPQSAYAPGNGGYPPPGSQGGYGPPQGTPQGAPQDQGPPPDDGGPPPDDAGPQDGPPPDGGPPPPNYGPPPSGTPQGN
ncbi:MAG TPA: hypothetical protein VGG48_19630 [Rhizomicrobium sp.]|jgi:hypothetical protein